MMNISNIQNSGYTSQNSNIGASGGEGATVVQQSSVQRASSESENLSKDEMRKQMMNTVDELNKRVDNDFQSLSSNIRFGFHENAGEMFVSVVDVDTNKQIRQLPSKEALSILSSMKELVGQIFDKRG
jgi:flagellar protein FlaG